ncbi:hypothetical protein [Methanofollis fontis]|uniref:DUF3566 domain-containing protein n=1 Tax=Methanofollis fontis TaxID=2052832 RepID=A0A483CVW8_9EURY|nr:hypothetical protein [Methanofollis fontis]TAJ45677.1 hypothetical protein CUJ86_02885 [Methanofollis fontis]
MAVIQRFGIVSVARINAAISLVIGLVLSVLWILFTGVTGVARGIDGGAIGSAAMHGAGGLVVIIFVTIVYAVVGFIAGALVALLYNVAAGWFGGIEMDLAD